MSAIVCTSYGPPEVLQLREIEKPVPKRDEVLIKMGATAVTSSDCIVRGFKIHGRPNTSARRSLASADQPAWSW